MNLKDAIVLGHKSQRLGRICELIVGLLIHPPVEDNDDLIVVYSYKCGTLAGKALIHQCIIQCYIVKCVKCFHR